LILEQEGFKVSVKADKVDARLQKYPKSYIESRMDILGRLLIFTRQLDMLMTTEENVAWVVENFVAGNYKLSAPPGQDTCPLAPPSLFKSLLQQGTSPSPIHSLSDGRSVQQSLLKHQPRAQPCKILLFLLLSSAPSLSGW